MSGYGARVGIEHNCGPVKTGRDLREQFKPLAAQRGFEDCKAGDVPTRAVEPPDEAAGDRVAHAHKDDRDRPRPLLDGDGRGSRDGHDDVGLQADQLLCVRSYPIDVTAGPPKVHPHVAAIGPTQVLKRLRERGKVISENTATAPPALAAYDAHRARIKCTNLRGGEP